MHPSAAENQVRRRYQVFREFGQTARGSRCTGDGRVEHYEIAAYGCLVTYYVIGWSMRPWRDTTSHTPAAAVTAPADVSSAAGPPACW